MSRIRIKNFGPVKKGLQDDDGWIDIKKVTVFIGNQGSGKSTVAKVISTLTWLEKAINRGDIQDLSNIKFCDFFEYQRAKNYFKNNTEIEYIGDKFEIRYISGSLPEITPVQGSDEYVVPKIMYVPAERNFLSVIENAFGVKNLPDTLHTFAEELKKAHIEINEKLLPLPIGTVSFKYNKENEASFLKGDDFEINLLEASSGYQSFVPLYLVTKFLSEELQKGDKVKVSLNVNQSVRREAERAVIISDKNLSAEEKNIKYKEIDEKYFSSCFINIVEEPEQNLFPTSQWEILKNLITFNNETNGNKLILTTHSPYIINYLTLFVKGYNLQKQLKNDASRERLNAIIPLKSAVNPDDLAIYELDETNGLIRRLGNYKGLPSDENYLNEQLAASNERFSELLDMENLCR
jgi:predicted ATPase